MATLISQKDCDPRLREQIKTFLDDVIALCRKHQFSISHEDIQGSFVIEPFCEDNAEWLRSAAVLNPEP